MASLINTKSFEAQARMFGIFAPRTKDKDGAVTGNFAVRIPSYSELDPEWRERVVKGVDILFSPFEKMPVSRTWKQGEHVHDMSMYKTPLGVLFTGSLALLVKQLPGVLDALSADGACDTAVSGKFIRSFERILEDIAATEGKEDGDKEARIIMSDMLARLGLLFQLPFVLPVPEEGKDALDTLHDTLFSAEFPKSLGAWRDLGIIQSHVFGASPFPIRGTDMFAFKSGDKNTGAGRGVEIKIGWDALLNARPALDAMTNLLAGGKAFGKDATVPAERRVQSSGKGGYTGDPNGIRSLSGETLFVPVPAEVRRKENPALGGEKVFVSLLHAMVKPWLNMALSPESLNKIIIPEQNLPAESKALLVKGRAAVETGGDIYTQKELQVKTTREEQSKKTEGKMDLTPRIVPYPGKSQLYILIPTDANVQAVKSAVSEFAKAESGMNAPEWRSNNRYNYSYAYITADRETSQNPLATLEGRNLAAKELSALIAEKTGVVIEAQMPESLNITVRVGGLAGRKGETYVFVDVPASADKAIRSAAKKGDLTISDEAAFLTDVKKILTDRTNDEDEECEVKGVGEMKLIANEDSRTVFGVNITPLAKEREAVEAAVECMRKYLAEEILEDVSEKYPNVSIGTAVRFTKDERARERERDLLKNLGDWNKLISNRRDARVFENTEAGCTEDTELPAFDPMEF